MTRSTTRPQRHAVSRPENCTKRSATYTAQYAMLASTARRKRPSRRSKESFSREHDHAQDAIVDAPPGLPIAQSLRRVTTQAGDEAAPENRRVWLTIELLSHATASPLSDRPNDSRLPGFDSEGRHVILRPNLPVRSRIGCERHQRDRVREICRLGSVWSGMQLALGLTAGRLRQ
jgi:hypothetical protein